MTKLEEKLNELELKEKLIKLGYETNCDICEIWLIGGFERV